MTTDTNTNINSTPEWTDERIRWCMDALEEVHYQWHLFSNATRPYDQADALIKLNDAIHDLSTYHPTYDGDNGTLGWEREDSDD